jgi:hypothetical protein
MHIDTTILCQHFLDERRPHMTDMTKKKRYWAKVLDLSSRPFKPQGADKSMLFRGSLQTDGVGVSIIKQDQDTKAGGPRKSRKRKKEQEKYISDLPMAELQQTAGKCVLIDPGRRDLLFVMHENSSIESKQLYRYTANQKSKETRSVRYRKLRTELTDNCTGVKEAGADLSNCNRSSVDPDVYDQFLATRARVTPVLKSLYEEKVSNHPNTDNFIFRKLRWSAYMNQKEADSRLASNLRNKFGEDAILVLGNWSCGNAKYHEPIRGIGMRRMLKHQGFQVLLLDEFGTSKHCPECHQKSLETFKRVPNPRPYRRQTYPTVTCNGLLRCTNRNCLESVAGDDKRRLFNRDLAAVLNFGQILLSLRAGNGIPLRFRRSRTRGRDVANFPS